MAHTGFTAFTDRSVGDILSIQRDRSARRLRETGQSVDKLSLTISLNSRDTHDLTFSHIEGDALHSVIIMCAGRNSEIPDREDRVRGLRWLFVNTELYVTADHHF